MKIVRPYARLMPLVGVNPECPFTGNEGIELLRRIEWAARISHRAEDLATDISYERFIRFVVMEKGDFSVVEHAVVSVLAYHDRGVQQEWTRHRLPSPTIESTRFVNYLKRMAPSFIYPLPDVECPYCLGGNEPTRDGAAGSWYHGERHHSQKCEYDPDWLDAIATSESKYKALIQRGWRPQEARSVFTLCLGSLMMYTANLRNWRHIMLMRTTQEAHPSFRQVTIPLLEEFKAKIPILFDDIEPNAKQSDNMKKMR